MDAPLLQSLARALDPVTSANAEVVLERAGAVWKTVRAVAVVPAVKTAVVMCLVMSVMLVVEKLSMAFVSLFVKVFRRSPEKVYKWEPMSKADAELGSLAYPMVLVQIPMYNEKEVYHLSIGAACGLEWPADRLIVQVLDDSTDPDIKDLVQQECQRWLAKGVNIFYESRSNRNGYKAGALKSGMGYDYVKICDYVAIFDADHQPPTDFLLRTVPFLIHNPNIALVQARWKFVNANECIMTRIQEMSLNYHFKVEQESGSSTIAFFGFNGTAGIWRILALLECEGWKERTTVEDMDLAVRATLRGWKFVYVGGLKVKSELPSTYKAYRFQQHRWACGPASLYKKMALDIIKAKKVPVWKKFYLIYNFFFARRIVSYNVTFLFYCVVIPISSFFHEVEVPRWGVVYVPTIITFLNSVTTLRSIHLILIWIFFENVMSLHRFKAVYIGLFEAGRVNEWVVTEKLGDTLKTQPAVSAGRRFHKFWKRFHLNEIGMGVFLLICASYDLLFRSTQYFIYIYPLAAAYFIMGFGYVGILVPVAK